MSKLPITAALAALASCAGDAPARNAPIAITEDFHFIEGGFSRGRGPDGNTGIFAGPDGLIVIDTGRHPGHAGAILDYARQRNLPIAAIVNTHWHLDHTTGNADIKAAFPGAKVYATRAVEGALSGFLARGAARSEEMLENDTDLTGDERAELERGVRAIREPTALLPDVAVEAPIKVPVDGRSLELLVTDRAVSKQDIWIWDPATKTAIVGDIVTLPAPFFDTACVPGWRAAFDAIEKKPFERVIPGHGTAMARVEWRIYRRAFDNLVACAAKEAGGECGAAWAADAAPLLSTDADRQAAKEYAAYYVENVLTSAEHRAEFCEG